MQEELNPSRPAESEEGFWSEREFVAAHLSVLKAISRHSSPEYLLQSILTASPSLFPFDTAYFAIWDTNQQLKLYGVCPRETDRTEFDMAMAVLAEEGFSLERNSSQISIPNEVRERGIRFAVCMPLELSSQVGSASLVFAAQKEIAWTGNHELLLQHCKEPFAAAFSDSLTLKALEKEHTLLVAKESHLNFLLEISRGIASTRDGDELVARMNQLLVQSLGCDLVNLIIYGEIEAFAVEVDLSIDDGVYFENLDKPTNQKAYKVYNSSKWQLFDEQDLREDPIYKEHHLRTLLMIPLVATGPIPGVLIVGFCSERVLSEEEIHFLESMSIQVSIGAENVRAYVEIVKLRNQLQREKLYLEDEIRRELRFDEIVGESKVLLEALSQVETVAATDSVVLILGETGTGKELFARAIHGRSLRNQRTFVKLNCAAIPMGLLESELFGHERGAFTGAIAQRIGRFELAHQGTLFLDEIGDIPLELQPKLLRALQEREFERLGSSRTIKVDVRVVAATHRDLEKMVAENQFRRDLYYRLKVFPITIPALRDRREDIPLLVKYFTQKFAQKMKKTILSISKEDMDTLVSWDWPGNVRELENIVERSVILTRGNTLTIPTSELKQQNTYVPNSYEQAERDFIVRTLENTKGKVGGKDGAAAILGIPRTTLLSKMKKLKIEARESRS